MIMVVIIVTTAAAPAVMVILRLRWGRKDKDKTGRSSGESSP